MPAEQSSSIQTPYALFSVSDKTGLVPLAQALVEAGYGILATGGTKRTLEEAGVTVESIEDYTGQPEILDGRVKTLHPKIHGGLLAKLDMQSHREELAAHGIAPIAVAVINLYPFVAAIDRGDRDEKVLRELIDVGGPTMLRAAAKNAASVLPVIDPSDYPEVIKHVQAGTPFPNEFRARLSAKVFTATAAYDLAIAKFLTLRAEQLAKDTTAPTEETAALTTIGPIVGEVFERLQPLRYGENPHQGGGLYRPTAVGVGARPPAWEVLQGKPLSYNNILDLHATILLMRAFPEGAASERAGVVIVKHLNPCGAAVRDSLLAALEAAKQGDPRSHFGGIVGCTTPVTPEVAEGIAADFAEIVVAPAVTPEASAIFARKKALRVVLVPDYRTLVPPMEVRQVIGGLLVQEADVLDYKQALAEVREARVMTGSRCEGALEEEVAFAWGLCGRVSSNAITLVKDGVIVGVGAGQMSRIDSAELAIARANLYGHTLQNAVAASDAFFPFPDTVEKLVAAGVRTIIAPGGAKRDEEAVAVARSVGATLLFAERRHFRH